MNKTTTKFAIGVGAALSTAAVLGTSAFATPADCIATDVKGSLQYTGDHLSGNPVNGSFVNVATNPDCSDDIHVHVFGTNDEPTAPGWLDNQVHVMTQTVTVPQDGADHAFQLTIPQGDYCWYQVDATRTSDVRIPPIYHGNDMVDYVYVQGRDCNTVTPTPTATPSATPTDTPTPTPGSNNGGGGSTSNSGGSSTPAKTVESIQATMGASTLAPTGGFAHNIMNVLFAAGMMIAGLGAVSYAKDKKANLS
jgi:hypothetical protein